MTRRSVLLGLVVAVAATLAGGGASAPAAPPPADRAAPVAVPILMYHRLSPAPAGTRLPKLWVTPRDFAGQVDGMARAGYTAVTLRQVWRSWHGGAALPAKPVVLSFDDGYRSQATVAAKVLRRRHWPGVLNLWLARLDAASGITRAEVRGMLRDGWELDAHSLTHPDLTKVDPARLQEEVAGSRAAIQREFGVTPEFFAYPYGTVDDAVEAAVRDAGFLGATTVRPGLARPDEDPYRLRRLRVDGGEPPSVLLRALRARTSH